MVSMNIAARNHCSRPMARHLHGHNVCAEISPKALPRLNFQVKHSGKFGLERASCFEVSTDARACRAAGAARGYATADSALGGLQALRPDCARRVIGAGNS